MEEILPLKGKVSHKKWRALIKKQKRKFKRQAAAQAKGAEEKEVSEEDEPSTDEEARLWEQKKREREERLWLERERRAQVEWQQKQEWAAKEKLRKEQEERRIREEWEEKEKKEKEEQERKEQEDEEKRKKQDELLKEATKNQKQDGEDWHNPLAPPMRPGVERDECPFFQRVGACRYRERCSRAHVGVDQSSTILFAGMYTHFELDQGLRDDMDSDVGLEYEEGETYDAYVDFYDDVFPEFRSCGRILQFKVCCNYEPHLRGNVYVQYEREEDALGAFAKFNGRWYGGKQLTCEFTHVSNWKQAVCGLFFRKKCPKGKNCNFMHVFRNPGNAFWSLEPESERFSSSYRRHRSRSRERSSRSHRHRRSRSRSPRQQRSRTRRRSRSSKSPSRRRKSRSRSSVRRRRSRSRSISRRSRSRSKSRRLRRSRRSRSHERRRRSRSKESERRLITRKPRSVSRSPNRKRSKSPGRDKILNQRSRSSSRSPTQRRKSSPSSPTRIRKSASDLDQMDILKSPTASNRSVSKSPDHKSNYSLPEQDDVLLNEYPSDKHQRTEKESQRKSISPSKSMYSPNLDERHRSASPERSCSNTREVANGEERDTSKTGWDIQSPERHDDRSRSRSRSPKKSNKKRKKTRKLSKKSRLQEKKQKGTSVKLRHLEDDSGEEQSSDGEAAIGIWVEKITENTSHIETTVPHKELRTPSSQSKQNENSTHFRNDSMIDKSLLVDSDVEKVQTVGLSHGDHKGITHDVLKQDVANKDYSSQKQRRDTAVQHYGAMQKDGEQNCSDHTTTCKTSDILQERDIENGDSKKECNISKSNDINEALSIIDEYCKETISKPL